MFYVFIILKMGYLTSIEMWSSNNINELIDTIMEEREGNDEEHLFIFK